MGLLLCRYGLLLNDHLATLRPFTSTGMIALPKLLAISEPFADHARQRRMMERGTGALIVHGSLLYG